MENFQRRPKPSRPPDPAPPPDANKATQRPPANGKATTTLPPSKLTNKNQNFLLPSLV